MSGPKLTTTATSLNPYVHDLELDDSGQPVWIGGDITDPTDYAGMVAQRLKCRWLFLKGEWYLDQRIGTPWLQSLFRKGVSVATVKAVFRTVALGTPGVKSVSRLGATLDRVAREATIDFALVMEGNKAVTSAQLDEPFVVQLPEVAR